MKIKELKKLIEEAPNDNADVLMQVMDDRQWVDCIASLDDAGTLAIEEKQPL